MAVDHYNTLGVLPGASAQDLRAAYLKLARANHPDLFTGAERARAEARMQEINEAWNVLGVQHKRREYDARNRAGAATGSADRQSPQRGRAHFRPFDDEPISRPDIDLDDTPIPGSRGVPRWVAFAPIALVAMGILVFSFGTMVDASGILALGIISFALGAVGFLLLPLLFMSRAERDPNL